MITMRGIDEINLIPNELIEERIIHHKIKKGIIFLSILIICLVAAAGWLYGSMAVLEKRVISLRTQDEKAAKLEKELTLRCQDIGELLAKKESIFALSKNYDFSPILGHLALVLNPETKINKLWIEKGLPGAPVPGKPVPAKPVKGKPVAVKARAGKTGLRDKIEEITDSLYEIKIWGVSKSYQTLSNFVFNLQNEPKVKQVMLLKSDLSQDASSENGSCESFIRFELLFKI